LVLGWNGQLQHDVETATISFVSIEDRDLTTIMVVLGDIREDVGAIRRLLEEENGGEEEAHDEDT